MENSATIHPDKQTQAQAVESRSLGRAERITAANGLTIVNCSAGQLMVQFITEQIIRVTAKSASDTHAWSGSGVVLFPENAVDQQVEEREDEFIIHSSALQAFIHKSDSSIAIYDDKGHLLARQEPVVWNVHKEAAVHFEKSSDSHFYALGEKTGFLDKAGERYEMWNSDVFSPHVPDIEALYQSIPFLIHLNEGTVYGLFLDNPGKTAFDMRSYPNHYRVSCETGSLDYYFIGGSSIKDVVSSYTGLTGRMQLPPVWSLGYQQSRYSYMNQEEVMTIARTFREKQIPCDVIYLDIHYMDEYRVFTFDPLRFPNPKQMIQELKELGIRIVPIVDPGVKKDPTYQVYRQGIEQGLFCEKLEGEVFIGKVWPGDSAFPDFTDQEAGTWWGDLHRYYTELGIAGIWNDMNEPSVFNDSKTMDLDVVHSNNGSPMTHKEAHNLYGMMMSKATYEGLERNLNGERPFVVTRAGYAGIQRYAAVWTGDNRSYWEHLALSIPMVLNLGLSGVAFAGPDIGGFTHHTSGELLARWTQAGSLFPFCRNHSMLDSIRQEPWAFGAEIEEICRTYIALRYRLMPYMYSLIYEASRSGLPVLRPLLLEFPDDPKLFNLCDQFLLGSHILAAPILRPSTDHRAVYLPEGTWYDYWTGERLEGGKHHLCHAPLSVMPLFIREGAIVPQAPLRQSLSEASSPELTIDMYCSGRADHQFDYYEDDGRTAQYKQGSYNLLNIQVNESPNQVSVQLNYRHKEFENGIQFIHLRMLYVPFVPVSVRIEDNPHSFDFNEQAGVLTVGFKTGFHSAVIQVIG
ncbi:glycoside hydrolase family 31 protein [Paenibacillus hexagrammi]|uniref:Glycoside hydrolase family 31 protein n=1 Tax=Paenibacillus hexagrammi TaxID=2908839 RepID=A0ABY3SIL9_9BACL|nr:glycoside hydrolase family 31 protein [Paenibacillus sp. YPD9-1]UJF33791.1 glycoside hydrolase family 31 protein [Paenibacillus sp. YPD9-1]